MGIHELGQLYDDLGAYPVPGRKGDKGDKGDRGIVIGGYPATLKGTLETADDLDGVSTPTDGDLYFVKSDGIYRYRMGDQWVMVIISGIPGKDGQPGQGVPAGGKAGDVLVKGSDADYDTKWVAYKDLWKQVTDSDAE